MVKTHQQHHVNLLSSIWCHIFFYNSMHSFTTQCNNSNHAYSTTLLYNHAISLRQLLFCYCRHWIFVLKNSYLQIKVFLIFHQNHIFYFLCLKKKLLLRHIGGFFCVFLTLLSKGFKRTVKILSKYFSVVAESQYLRQWLKSGKTVDAQSHGAKSNYY